MKFFKLFILLSLISFNTLLGDSYFFMPKEAKQAEKEFVKQIRNAKKNIDIAIYSFTNKKIKKALAKAAKRGVKIRIVTDRKGAYKKNRTGDLAKLKNVEAYTVKGKRSRNKAYHGKMHLKLAVIDNETICHGSANWSYSGFGLNYETFIVQKDRKLAGKFQKFYQRILEKSKKY